MRRNKKSMNFLLRLIIVFLCISPLLFFTESVRIGINLQKHGFFENKTRVSIPYLRNRMANAHPVFISVNNIEASLSNRTQKKSNGKTQPLALTFFQGFDVLKVFSGFLILGILAFLCNFNRHVLLPHSIHAPPVYC